MARHFQFRHGLVAGTLALLFVSFQNCAPKQENTLCPLGEVCDKAAQASKALTGSSSYTPVTNNTGVVTIPVVDVSDDVIIPGTDDSGEVTTESGKFGFYKNLDSKLEVKEGENFTLNVQVANGDSPFTYTWYLGNDKLKNLAGNAPALVEVADRFTKEGKYSVEVRDSKGKKIISRKVDVSIREREAGCAAGEYSMLANNEKAKQVANLDIEHLYSNPRGKFLVAANYNTTIATLMSGDPSYFGISVYKFRYAKFNERRSMSCETDIPRFNDAKKDTRTVEWKATGSVTVECHNDKWLLVKNTCEWKSTMIDTSSGRDN